MRKALKTIGIVLLAVVILAGGLIGYLTITEFRPASVQDAAPRRPGKRPPPCARAKASAC